MLHVKFDQPGTGDDFLSAMVNSIEASINMYFGVARPVIFHIDITPRGCLTTCQIRLLPAPYYQPTAVRAHYGEFPSDRRLSVSEEKWMDLS